MIIPIILVKRITLADSFDRPKTIKFTNTNKWPTESLHFLLPRIFTRF